MDAPIPMDNEGAPRGIFSDRVGPLSHLRSEMCHLDMWGCKILMFKASVRQRG
jgi:hypothetical protein